MTRTYVFGNRVLTAVARMLSKEDITDLSTGVLGLPRVRRGPYGPCRTGI